MKITKLEDKHRNIRWVVIIGMYIIQTLIFLFMSKVTFPIIQEHIGTYKLFDMMKEGYDITAVREILQQMSTRSRNTYLYLQMPLDFIYPVIMACVYYLVFVKCSKKSRYLYVILPLLLVFFDWSENICIIYYLTCSNVNEAVVRLCVCLTRGKAFLGDKVLFIGMWVWIVKYLFEIIMKRRQQRLQQK